MAMPHLHIEVHALDTFWMISGLKSSRWMYGSTFSIVSAVMPSLSNSRSDERNATGSWTILLDASQ